VADVCYTEQDLLLWPTLHSPHQENTVGAMLGQLQVLALWGLGVPALVLLGALSCHLSQNTLRQQQQTAHVEREKTSEYTGRKQSPVIAGSLCTANTQGAWAKPAEEPPS
jgi:hypothetical protein